MQMGVISPSKLRMKLLGVHNSRRKEGTSNSSRTSPSKLEELEYAKNHLLTNDLDEESTQSCSVELRPVETDMTHLKSHNITRQFPYQNQIGGSLSSVHPMKSIEDDNGNDSGYENGSTSSFEFHLAERASNHPFFRNLPSKWNDAEKWIHPNALKKNVVHSHGNRPMIGDLKRTESINSGSQNVAAKFSFVPQCLQPKLLLANGMNELGEVPRDMGDLRGQCRIEKEEDQKASVSEKPVSQVTATQTVDSVSMRDIGTEMTPVPSQEPSRTTTPMESTTPTKTPISSTPSTPRNGAKFHKNVCQDKGGKHELSERELKLKTRREIAALGVKLGKMNIASWASKEAESAALSPKNFDAEQKVKEEYEARAKAWEEAEKAKHMARYTREGIKIQAWEEHERAKVEAKMRKLEVHFLSVCR
ncbi:uncharacterized protein LOC109850222 isoform X2 [Asparagus officinalis]|uniref:uncharacterized protein LOC109850222 isoform X2 n=1 Tax=Asparagus officinalis TaxID=4686 RepID=UPI00098E8028|nr:uncharacterized protein LOC109850222 isoform X2 [Asparagus officinalis]